ncbi:MAG: 2-phosphoglycolate phosphatase, prokaryotic:HAD-superfamily hydrolase, subfamily variant 1 [Proteobacteria bacterium]|nr:2-phosphoglycolate phosphatase, prokaryotic:HAD-superfamily hydrolase, subfamily variant 1 [Pseudomonadota bacterium]
MFDAVLFDLDGTLADTAPDLGWAANALREEEGLAPLPLATLRPWTSQGVRGLLRVAFEIAPGDTAYDHLAHRFLALYAERLCVDTRLFDGVAELLDELETLGLAWGIVTNKRMRFTDPLVAQLGLTPRTTCVVSGDTTAEAKPSPLPILHACQLLNCRPERTLYVGDDRRDIVAGNAAGCRTVAAAYGYLGDSGPIPVWGADLLIETPMDLAGYLR